MVDLCERGLHAEDGLLAVIDGSKALKRPLKRCLARACLFNAARYTRNGTLKITCLKSTWQWTKQQLNQTYAREDADHALRDVKSLATKLETTPPTVLNDGSLPTYVFFSCRTM